MRRKLVGEKILRRIPIASLRAPWKLKRRPTLISFAQRQESDLISFARRQERALISFARRQRRALISFARRQERALISFALTRSRKMVGEKILRRIPIASLRATWKLKRRLTLISIARRRSKAGRRMTRTSMCDLPTKLVGEKILTRVPITSLRAVRSTCKLWESLTKAWILGKASATRQQFLWFMTMNSKVCSIRFHLCRSKGKEEEDLVDLSVKQVDLLNQFEISNVFHCDGLLLCVAKDISRLMVWNPYLGQTKWIRSITEFQREDIYAIGYDINQNHKILRYLADYFNRKHVSRYEIYDFSSNSWRLLDVTPDWDLDPHRAYGSGGRGVSVKGNAYFFAVEHGSKFEPDEYGEIEITDIEDFLMCFDFTTETFGPRLPLPFHSCLDGCVSLSCVRDEKLAVLHHNEALHYNWFSTVDFWVTTTIEPNSVSWSKFLKVNMRPFTLSGVRFDNNMGASFFIDEEEKVAVVFDIDGYISTRDDETRYHTAFISGQDEFFKPVSLGVAPKIGEPCPFSERMPNNYCPPVVCYSSYLPSLVQLN